MTVDITISHHVGLVAKFLGPTDTLGSRIKVKRADHRAGDRTLTVSWDYSLGLPENYAAAITQFINTMVDENGDSWGGHWLMAHSDTGYVATKIPKDLTKENDATT